MICKTYLEEIKRKPYEKKPFVLLVWLGPLAPLLQFGEEQNHPQGN
jgi:hypothetical protein